MRIFEQERVRFAENGTQSNRVTEEKPERIRLNKRTGVTEGANEGYGL